MLWQCGVRDATPSSHSEFATNEESSSVLAKCWFVYGASYIGALQSALTTGFDV